jgi:TatD DNase family protein
VDTFVVPGIDAETSARSVSLAAAHPGLFCAVGIHPGAGPGESFATIPRLALEPRVRAIGETGLDFARDEVTPRRVQEELFEQHMELARRLSMPLVVHSRRAEGRVIEMIPRTPGFPVILHCYTGGEEDAAEAVRRGFYVSFAGALTWKKNTALRQVALGVPRSGVLVETDSPFMSPEGSRGRRNEPCNVLAVAGALSAIWGAPLDETAAVLLGNAEEAFRLGARTSPSLVYILGRKAYVNLTGRCTNDCTFCIRRSAEGIGGYHLRQEDDMPADRFLDILSVLSPGSFEELVFCGFGEPTMRPDALEAIASGARARGWRIRLNTNGQAASFLPRERVLGLIRLFDSLSISLNAWDAGSYAALCRPAAPASWEALMDFITIAKGSGVPFRLSAVRAPEIDMAAVRRLAESLGAPLLERGSG